MRIGIISSNDFNRISLIYQLIQKIKSDIGIHNCVIVSAANGHADIMVKHSALENEFTYKEYNPAYTGQNLHSANHESYYNKTFHISQLHHRYQELFRNVDAAFIFIQENEDDKILLRAIKKIPKKLNHIIIK